MVWRDRILSFAILAGIAGAGMPACFSDLPPPTTLVCPGAETRAIDLSACGDSLLKAPQSSPPASPFCVSDPSVHECVLGPRASASCTCGNGGLAAECPETEDTCFPAPECPAIVKGIAADARCLRPSAESFTGASGCACGCAACARICDGKGPSIAVRFPGSAGDPPAPLLMKLPPLPAQGRLSVYVRIRGIASLAVGVAREGAQTPLLSQPLNVNNVHFVEMTFGPTAAWTDSSTAPEIVALLAQPGPTAAEVDCIIPFVTP